MSDAPKKLDKERVKKLREDINDFRSLITEDLVKHFKGKSVKSVVETMADWLDLDSLVELKARTVQVRQILKLDE